VITDLAKAAELYSSFLDRDTSYLNTLTVFLINSRQCKYVRHSSTYEVVTFRLPEYTFGLLNVYTYWSPFAINTANVICR